MGADIGEYAGGLWAEPPAASKGRAPGLGVWGEASQKLKAFWYT